MGGSGGVEEGNRGRVDEGAASQLGRDNQSRAACSVELEQSPTERVKRIPVTIGNR